MTALGIESGFFGVLESLEDDFMEMADEIRGKLIDWIAAVTRDELSLNELVALLEGEKALLEMIALQKKVETRVLLNTLRRDLVEKLVEIVRRAL